MDIKHQLAQNCHIRFVVRSEERGGASVFFHLDGLTCGSAQTANHLHDLSMRELLTRANQASVESQHLRRERRSLRFEASALTNRIGHTIVQSQRAARDSARLKTSLDQALSDSAAGMALSCPLSCWSILEPKP
jgi:hypothetical protein